MFNVIYVDPPWTYQNKKTGGSHTSGSEQKYPTLTVDELKALPIVGTFDKDAVCFLWSTTPLGQDPFEVLKAWKFRYITKLYWHKTGRLGTGYHFRGEVEEILAGAMAGMSDDLEDELVRELIFAIRGRVPAARTAIRNWVDAPVGEHSMKPELFREIIEQATARTIPERRYLELFATRYSTGWTSLGLALNGVDLREQVSQDVLLASNPSGEKYWTAHAQEVELPVCEMCGGPIGPLGFCLKCGHHAQTS